MPEPLREDIVWMEKRNCTDIYNYVTMQVPVRMDDDLRKRGKAGPLYQVEEQPNRLKEDDRYEADAAALSLQKGSKGAGKTGLGLTAAFSGQCHYCKEKVHRRPQCSKLTADRARQ